MNNADLIVATLKAAGIDRGFGIPSGNVLPLMEAMRKGGVDFVLTAHEGSAGFAADVTGRLTGAPGLCIATLGPGATNLATGVGDAWLDRSPLIAITCNLNTDQLGRRIQMWIDHHALFRPITKATLQLRKGEIGATLAEAIRLALSEPMGPVHLDLPEDVALAETNEPVPSFGAPSRPAPADDAAIERAAELIAAAKRPIAVLGSSAMRIKYPARLLRAIEHYGLPFATTTMAKGMIAEDHPLALGCIERACRQVQRRVLRSADLIVGLGYDTIEVEYEAWIGDLPLVQIDIEPVDIAPSVNLVHQVTGDLDSSLARLVARPEARNAWTRMRSRRIAQPFRPRCGRQAQRSRPIGHRRGAPRLAARRRAGVRRRRPHPPDRQPMAGVRTEEFSDHQRLVVHGLRLARRHRRQAGAARSAGRLFDRRRLFPDDLRRGRDREALRHRAAHRGARRQMAGPHQGQAGAPPVPALRHRTAARRLSRAA